MRTFSQENEFFLVEVNAREETVGILVSCVLDF